MPKNAAERLYKVLTKVQYPVPNGSSDNAVEDIRQFDFDDEFDIKVPVFEAGWRGVDIKNVEDVLPVLSGLLAQLDDIENQVRLMMEEPKASLRLKYFSELRRGICELCVNPQPKNVKDRFSPQALYSLEIISTELDDEPEIQPSDLQAIKATVDELFALVNESDINKRLRTWIMTWLSNIKRAIDRYEITGPRGLQDALVQIQGEASIFQPALQKVEKDAPTLYERLQDLFNKICKASDVGDRCRKLCESPLVGYVGSVILRTLGVHKE